MATARQGRPQPQARGRRNMMDAGHEQVADAVRRLVDEYRDRCLWFLRADYYPEGTEEILRVLDYIERHGDRRAYLRAARIKKWRSRPSSASSAAS